VGTEDIRNMIWDYTRRIKDGTNKAFTPLCEKHGLTMMQGRIITELHHSGPKSIGNLADGISVAGANLSAMCKKMEDQGFVKRNRDSTDERKVQVELTERGLQIAQDIDSMLLFKLQKVLETQNELTLDEIIKGMVLLTDLLDQISEVKVKQLED